MPQLTINGKVCDFEQGQSILEVALANEEAIPHYCWHESLSVVANCRICLGEVWAPNPRNEGKLEVWPKLVPTCQTPCSEGMVVHTDSPKAIGNQKSVMEYLLINHPVDCPVCDQAGECHLQDYAYQYGRAESRFLEAKIKAPKKDIGEHVLLYSDRCIMCTRCVRFTQEITGTGELIVDGRGATEQIDVFPGMGLDNELSANVVDLCPVGALLDKDFLFKKRVWFLTKTPSIDGLTASGDNLTIEHAEGSVHRFKPRPNPAINRFWITDEVRYGWKFVHSEDRINMPSVAGMDPWEDEQANEAWMTALTTAAETLRGKKVGVVLSPMLPTEEAFRIAEAAQALGQEVVFGLGPVPMHGADKTFKDGFVLRAEKAPNARGVRAAVGTLGDVHEWNQFLQAVDGCEALLVTGNYPSAWCEGDALTKLTSKLMVCVDTLHSPLTEAATVVLPGATWMEKSGCFTNATGTVQAFERAIKPVDFAKCEGWIAEQLLAESHGNAAEVFHPCAVRERLADAGLSQFANVVVPEAHRAVESDMTTVEI
ncbi:MAG: molybdopterin-dependent oxidoreductase [Planctomycetota bacterium]|nr:molybdopterin-dependent oxidoreductase [Planctomycetota bacterium]